MQSDPLGLEAGWNTYAYVGNSPVEAMDPWGLSERDVKKINQIYNATLIDLNKKGRRSKHGDLLNNAFSVDEYGEFSSSPLTWLLNAINKPILGRDIVASDFGYQNFNEICVGQATILQNGLQSYRNAGTEEKPSFDDKWTFALVNNKNHYWVEAYSNNPNDPELMLDLWKNIRKTRPYGSGKRSPHLGKGVVWK